MKLSREFIRLPFTFDAGRLRDEVAAVPESAWKPHPQGFAGNDALLLVAADGEQDNDALIGDMQATPVLQQMPYLRQVMAHFGSAIGRSRLMRISDHEEVKSHSDVHYYWRDHLRIHVPIQTDPSVTFTCGDESLHMGEGECWIFDTWRRHRVENPSSRQRIHLVLDTRGSWELWRTIRQALDGSPAIRHIAFDATRDAEPMVEGPSAPVVMSPTEFGDHIDFLLRDLRASASGQAAAALPMLAQALSTLRAQWQGLWRQFGATQDGWPHYRALISQVRQHLARSPGVLQASDGTPAAELIERWLVEPVLNPGFAQPGHLASLGPRKAVGRVEFQRPVFIVAAPRSGSSLLFETLARSPDLWTVGGESHAIFEGIEALSPAAHGFDSNALDAGDAADAVVEDLRRRFAAQLRDRDGAAWTSADGPVVMLEKTPKNALRIPFLAKAFPEARFIYLVREPFANTSSILEAWRSGGFITYPKLPDWKGGPWSLLLTPGWRELAGKSLAEVAVAQYEAANAAIMEALGELPSERWTAVNYADVVAEPFETMDRLGEVLGIHWDRPPPLTLPQSATTLTAPESGKWRANSGLLSPFADRLTAVRKRIAEATGIELADLSEMAKHGMPDEREAAPPASEDADAGNAGQVANADMRQAAAAPAQQQLPPDVLKQLSSNHSASFAEVLRRGGCSLAISTYQAGKLVLARMENDSVNTAFKSLPKPMGIAVDQGRMAVGTAQDVLFLQQSQSPPPAPGRTPSDARFLPRGSHVTGNIDIHEMAWVGDELWIVNTRFCCLATLAPDASFVPRWKPPFLTALAPEDRCHLNGLAVRDGRVRYVTMLGETDTQGGWRENKASGGLLYDIVEERVICRGLSMPHSPRWYNGKLYVLESGNGGLCEIDPETGEKDTLIELPGFTRGMDFLGPLAFIGLSQVRESAVFAKLPLTERLDERHCGVWVVNLNKRELVGFLRFEEAVQEIFSVNVLPGLRHPDLHVPGEPLLADAFVLPDAALASIPKALRTSAA